VRRAVLVLALTTLAVLLASAVAFALPTETPDNTPMVNGRVRAIEQVGNYVWLGGKFTKVKQRDGTVLDSVTNVAVFNSETDQYVDIAPMLDGSGSEVWDMTLYGDAGDILIAGKFVGSTTKQKNLVLVDGSTGQVIRWFNSPGLKSALAAPQLEGANGSVGRVYGGGVSLSAFDVATGKKLWTRARTTVDTTLHANGLAASYRDLELDADGSTIWAACGCDAVAGNPAKALVKLDIEGNHDASWVAEAPTADAYGISVAQHDAKLYLGAGGVDFLAEYPKEGNGSHTWLRDTSGSTQVVEVMDDQLIIGGHFWEVADGPDDSCGHRSSSDPSALDPSPGGECETRHGLAVYTFEGVLDGGGTPEDIDDGWNPMLEGKYSLAWALQPEGARLHVGGDFRTVNGVTQAYYTRFSSALLP
jgi:hypothetical protein